MLTAEEIDAALTGCSVECERSYVPEERLLAQAKLAIDLAATLRNVRASLVSQQKYLLEDAQALGHHSDAMQAIDAALARADAL